MILVALAGILLLLPSIGLAKSVLDRSLTWKAKGAIAQQLNAMKGYSGKEAFSYSSRGVNLTQVKQKLPVGFGAMQYDAKFTAVPRMKIGGCMGTCELNRPIVLKPIIKAYNVQIGALLRSAPPPSAP
jgi:hypothetical protein